MNVYPFIAAEKAAAHHVATACALLEVSPSAYASIGRAGARTGHRVSITRSGAQVSSAAGGGWRG